MAAGALNASDTYATRRARLCASVGRLTAAAAHTPIPSAEGPCVLGRSDALAAIAEALESQRVVTLVGAPGIGKTTIAGEVAGRHGARAAVVEL
ncbi:MAG: hypothetical protein ACRDMZ_24645, partial [Solirubrobacteraceae bacterium]